MFDRNPLIRSELQLVKRTAASGNEWERLCSNAIPCQPYCQNHVAELEQALSSPNVVPLGQAKIISNKQSTACVLIYRYISEPHLSLDSL